MLAYRIAVLVHILAMAIWVDGSLFLVLVMLPLARWEMNRPEDGARLLCQVSRKYRPVAWSAIGLLGSTNAHFDCCSPGDHNNAMGASLIPLADWTKTGIARLSIPARSEHGCHFGERREVAQWVTCCPNAWTNSG